VEAARVDHDAVRGAGVVAGAGGVLDANVILQRGGLAAAGCLHSLQRSYLLDVTKVQTQGVDRKGTEGIGFGQAGKGVGTRDASQIDRSGDQPGDACGGEIGG